MPNGHPFWNWLPSPRRLAGVAVLGAVLHATPGCQRLPLRSSEIEALATAKPTTVVDPASDPSAPSSPRETAPPEAAAAAPSDLETAVLGARDEAKTAAEAPGAIAPTTDKPLLDVAVARVEGQSSTPTTAVETPATGGPVELPIVANAPASATPKAPDAPLEPVIPTAPDPKPVTPPHEQPESTSAPTKAEPPSETEAFDEEEVPKKDDDAKPASVPASKPVPEPKPMDVEKPVEPVATSPRDDWSDTLNHLREFARRRAGAPGDAAEAWGIRAHVLDWLAGEGDDPRNPTSPAWNRVLAALSTATTAETIDEAALAHHLSAAVDTLESYAPFQIRALSLCRKVDGYGQYEPLDKADAHPGRPVLVYCELDGLRYEEEADGFRSRLASRVEVVSATGGAPIWSHAFGTAEDHCRRRRRDYYAHYVLPLPATVAPGDYTLRLTQTDLVSGRSVSAALDLHVSP